MRRRTNKPGVFLLLLVPFTIASIVNRTIDDSFGDSETQQLPVFLPVTGAWNNQSCEGCAIQPDKTKAFNGTYTAATYKPERIQNVNISMGFEGTAIYVYFILPNKQGDGVTTLTMTNFTIDGQFAGNFTHVPDLSTTTILYNQMVFSKTDIPNGIHQLVISISGLDFHVFVNFDYAIYTHINEDTVVPPFSSSFSSSSTHSSSRTSASFSTSSASLSTSSTSLSTSSVSTTSLSGFSSKPMPNGAIAGVAVGGVILLGVMVTLLLYSRRRRRKNQTSVQNPFLIGSFSNHGDHVAPAERNGGSMRSWMQQYGITLSNSKSRGLSGSDEPPALASESILPSSGSGLQAPTQKEVRLARQREINRRLRIMTEEMDQLARGRMVDLRGGNAGPMTEDHNEINRMREQVQAMRAQIVLLRSQQRGSGVQGLSNGPPPGYRTL